MRTNIEIEYPDHKTKEESIQMILDTSMMQAPEKAKIFRNITKNIGFRYLFFGMKDTLSLTLVCICVLYLSLYLSIDRANPLLYLEGFLAAPVPFLLFQCISAWNDRSVGMEEIKLTFRYRGKEVLCTQMIVMTMLSFVLSTVFAAFSAGNHDAGLSVFHVCMISYLGLLIYALGTFMTVLHGTSFISSYIMPMIWTVMTIVFLYDSKRINAILQTIPQSAAVICFIAGITMCTVLAVREYKRIYQMGGIYAAD